MQQRTRVKRRIVIGGGRRVLLYFWAHETAPRVCNLLCLDGEDRVVWKAELPPSEQADCFTSVEREGDALLAGTYRGATVRLCAGTGRPLDRATATAA